VTIVLGIYPVGMAEAVGSYLDPATLSSIGSLDLRARMVVEGLMTGMHKSPMHGFSVEFAQHRQYTPGDDTRFLDWKVYGKTDKLYLKQHHKETNLDLIIMIDGSGSMAYSSPITQEQVGRPWRKFDHAATITAATSYLALQQQDRVQLVVYDDDIVTQTRLSNSQGHWRDVARTLEQVTLVEPTQALGSVSALDPDAFSRSSLGRTFDRVISRLTQRSLIMIVSDLMDDPEVLDQALARLHHKRHDVMLVQVLDEAEQTFPFRAASDFVGLESEGKLAVFPEALKQAYLETVDEHLQRVDASARKFQFDVLRINTLQSVGSALSHFLAKRSAVAGGRSSA